jgi:hypothetical protein
MNSTDEPPKENFVILTNLVQHPAVEIKDPFIWVNREAFVCPMTEDDVKTLVESKAQKLADEMGLFKEEELLVNKSGICSFLWDGPDKMSKRVEVMGLRERYETYPKGNPVIVE